jgi:hypothetical protein
MSVAQGQQYGLVNICELMLFHGNEEVAECYFIDRCGTSLLKRSNEASFVTTARHIGSPRPIYCLTMTNFSLNLKILRCSRNFRVIMVSTYRIERTIARLGEKSLIGQAS